MTAGTGERPAKSAALRAFNVFVGDEYYNVEVEEVGGKTRARAVGNTAPIVMKNGGPRKKKEKKKKDRAEQPGACTDGGNGSEFTLTAPMPGMVISYEVKEGDSVSEGDVLVVLEAMKMQNSLTSAVTGTIKSIKVSPGTSVEKNQVILTISN